MPNAFELRMRGQFIQLLIDIRALQINPTHYTCNKTIFIRQAQQPTRLGNTIARLNNYDLIDSNLRLRRQIIAIKQPEIARHTWIVELRSEERRVGIECGA